MFGFGGSPLPKIGINPTTDTMSFDRLEINLSEYIDLALLKPTATSQEIEQCCWIAQQYNFPTICVYPNAVKQARELLHNKKTKICTVIGFPTGATTTAVKLYEALEAVENGAVELDVAINLSWLKTGNSEAAYTEIAKICEETQQTVKAIIETNLLDRAEKKLAAQICLDAGADFIKTNTGWFGPVKVEDVKLLSEITNGLIGIKAAGGIRNINFAIDLIRAGATRLGTSRGLDLLEQLDRYQP